MKKNTAKSISILALIGTILLTGCSKNSKDNCVHSDVLSDVSFSGNLIDNQNDEIAEEIVDTSTLESHLSDEIDLQVDGPSITIHDVELEHCENENYENQVAFCNDLMSMVNCENKEFEFFRSDEEAYQFYSDHFIESYYLYYLNKKVDIPDIVNELNNLYVLSQVPSCIPENYWNFMFAHLTKTMQGYSLYEEYIDLATFIHDNSLNKDLKLALNKD